jgi:HEAT repeat protein
MLAPRILLSALLLPLLLAASIVLFRTGGGPEATTAPETRPPISVPGTKLDDIATGRNAAPIADRSSALLLRVRTLFGFASPSERLELMRLLQSLGEHGSDALPVLKDALAHTDQDVRRAAMRGLAATQSQEAIAVLQTYLSDSIAIEESTEAALALATMANPSVTPLLQGALEQSKDAVLREHIVDALVSRPPAEVDIFVDSFLARPDIALEEKQNLLRMSGLNNTKPAEFLAAHIQSTDELLRLGAYQGLALISESRQAQTLMPRVAIERDPFKRALVYEALGNQIDANARALGALADAESDSYARLRALKAWTESVGRENLPLAGDSTSPARVDELQDAALSHPDFAERRVALFALGFARHDSTVRPAIERIAQESTSEKIRALAAGLLANPE